jgi:hypothetical protein
MSALGHKLTFIHLRPTSALPPKADIAERHWDVRFVPKADMAELDCDAPQCTFSTGGIAHVPSIADLRGEYSRA